jgi:hypothetical protein
MEENDVKWLPLAELQNSLKIKNEMENKNNETIIELLKSINENLKYVKLAVICDHLDFKLDKKRDSLNHYYTCIYCGAGLSKGEKE